MSSGKGSEGRAAPKKAGDATERSGQTRLVMLGSAAVMAIYGAGYVRTRGAAEEFANDSRARHAPAPAPEAAVSAPVVSTAPAKEVAVAPPAVAAKGARAAARKTSVPGKAQPPASPVEVAVASAPASVPLETAPAPAQAPVGKPAEPEPVAEARPGAGKWKDGTYLGWGTSRHGDIQAKVVIIDGYIASAAIAQCLTRYSCSWIAALPGQVTTRQSAEVDYVSGATQSSNAFYDAVVDALNKAK